MHMSSEKYEGKGYKHDLDLPIISHYLRASYKSVSLRPSYLYPSSSIHRYGENNCRLWGVVKYRCCRLGHEDDSTGTSIHGGLSCVCCSWPASTTLFFKQFIFYFLKSIQFFPIFFRWLSECKNISCFLWSEIYLVVYRYNVLGSVESIVGGVCSVSISLLLPSIFYYK